ncbi:hypothetical protein T484DRAFT_1760807 [Baffinella frigidus]|nr:hypothetical protein T484DRAFT_1760807 [Cryptophyta sp. CCMP2293]
MCPCLATGGYDLNKHKDVEDAARSELSEECGLCEGTWERLLPADHPGVRLVSSIAN